MPISWRTFHF